MDRGRKLERRCEGYRYGDGMYWRLLPRKGRNRYITGGPALNLGDPASGETGGAADWHGSAPWVSTCPTRLVEHIGGEEGHTTPWEAIGEEGIRNGRDAVSSIGHPEATLEKEIWVASHTRAILDIAYRRWRKDPGRRPVPIGRAQVSDWIWTPDQMAELKRWIAETTFLLPENRRRVWKTWGEGLIFGASHDDYLRMDAAGGHG